MAVVPKIRAVLRSNLGYVSVPGFQVKGLRFKLWGVGFWVSCFEFRVSGFGFRVSGFGLGVAVAHW